MGHSRTRELPSITRAYYKNSVCALIVYDISSKESFNNVSTWIDDCRSQSPKTITLILVGNKCDLDEERQVTFAEGEEFAKDNGMLFFEASAKTGHNIEQVFEQSAIEIARKIEENCYDLTNESCGIKIGVNNESSGGNMKLNKQTKNQDSKKKCC